MTTTEQRIAKEEQDIAQMEMRIAAQVRLLQQHPSQEGEKLLEQMRRMLRIGQEHLCFERGKLAAGQ